MIAGHLMNIEERFADLLYSLAEIRAQTDDSRIRLMAKAMEATVMEMDALVYRDVSHQSQSL